MNDNEFRLGVADDESDGSARYSGKSWLKSNMGGTAGEDSRPCRGMEFFYIYAATVYSKLETGWHRGSLSRPNQLLLGRVFYFTLTYEVIL